MDHRLVERAFSDFAELLRKADEIRLLFEQAQMPLPEPLKRLLGLSSDVSTTHQLPAMRLPPQPDGHLSSWIWIPADQCTVGSLVLAVLRGSSVPIPVQKIIEEVARLKGDEVNPGSIANIGTRLDTAGLVTRDDQGWMLTRPESAPILWHKHLWGRLDVFEKQEVAAHRRMAIVHVLGLHETGLQIVQIVEMIHDKAPWFNRDIPCNKDLLKADMEVLGKQGKVKKQGNSGKWIIQG